MSLCVYALARGPARFVRATGVSGERLRLVRSGPIAAVVGELPRAPRPSPALLQRYDAIVQTVASRFPAVLPVRFGTIFDSLDELLFVLQSRRESLERGLAHVRHRAQMTIRMIDGGPGVARQAASRRVSLGPRPSRRARSGSGAAYLRGRAEAAARARQIPAFEPVREAVRRWVRDERIDRRSGVTTVYHLVPRGSVDAYRRALERSASASGLQLVVTGAWPAYAFTEI